LSLVYVYRPMLETCCPHRGVLETSTLSRIFGFKIIESL
jgi:hypothetical protein